MMAYGKVHETFWDDPRMRSISEPARMMMLYLMTCRHKNRLGCYVLDSHYAAADLQWTPETVAQIISELVDAGRIIYDRDHRIVLVLRFLKHNTLENGKVVTGALADLRGLPDTPLLPSLLSAVEKYSRPHYDALIQELRNRIANHSGNDTANGMAYRGPAHPSPVPSPTPKPEQHTESIDSGAAEKKVSDEPPAPNPPDTTDSNIGAVIAPAVREHLWLGNAPPERDRKRGWNMGREIDVARKIVKDHRASLEELVGAVGLARSTLDFAADEPLTLRIFNVQGRHDQLAICVAAWKRERLREAARNGSAIPHILTG